MFSLLHFIIKVFMENTNLHPLTQGIIVRSILGNRPTPNGPTSRIKSKVLIWSFYSNFTYLKNINKYVGSLMIFMRIIGPEVDNYFLDIS